MAHLHLSSKNWQMNPYMLWWNKSEKVKIFLDDVIILDTKVIEKNDAQIANLLKNIYSNGNLITRIKVITLSGILKKILADL